MRLQADTPSFAALTTKIRARFSADRTVVLWLGVWWLCNLLQAAGSELANDEAYYHLFAERLTWGYFDHPPMTALLVRLGESLLGGEIGVRLCFTLLQPLYLYIFWRLIRPAKATRHDGALFVMISAATLMLQLYGFLAVPDGPLMMTAVLFLLAFERFAERRRGAWLWMGIALALMAYSKYHGALVLLFALAANPRLLRRPDLYLSGAVAALLLVPHLVWQYDHDWASIAYHLAGRNARFRLSYVTDFAANMLVVFNPLYVPIYIRAWRKTQPDDAARRALKLFPAAFIGFFLLSACRGYVQPQWVIVASLGLIYVAFDYARRHPRTRRYMMCAGWVTLALVALVRLEMIFNPLRLRFEVFDNRATYAAIAREAAGRPVIFGGNYAVAAKYRFYTGDEAYCQPDIRYRTHQWQFRDDDSRFIGREALVETPRRVPGDTLVRTRSIALANGKEFTYMVDPAWHPVRRVDIAFEGVPHRVAPGQELHLRLRLTNPYDYPIEIGESCELAMLWKSGRHEAAEFALPVRLTLAPRSTTTAEASFRVPETLAGTGCETGFALRREGYKHWFNGKPRRTKIDER